jgi:hypothetical protein
MRQALISLALLVLVASATATTGELQAASQGNDAAPVLYNRRMLTFGLFHPWFHHSKVRNPVQAPPKSSSVSGCQLCIIALHNA